jgi:hypothetical protein
MFREIENLLRPLSQTHIFLTKVRDTLGNGMLVSRIHFSKPERLGGQSTDIPFSSRLGERDQASVCGLCCIVCSVRVEQWDDVLCTARPCN